MKLLVYTNDNTPAERDAIELAKEIEDEGQAVEYLNLDDDESRPGSELYDIYSVPSMVVVQEDGRLVEVWREQLPGKAEILNFLR